MHPRLALIRSLRDQMFKHLGSCPQKARATNVSPNHPNTHRAVCGGASVFVCGLLVLGWFWACCTSHLFDIWWIGCNGAVSLLLLPCSSVFDMLVIPFQCYFHNNVSSGQLSRRFSGLQSVANMGKRTLEICFHEALRTCFPN